MRDRLITLRGKKFIGVGELAEQAAKILSESGLVQERGTVTEVPDERTIRYYLSEGLLSPAEDKQGTASVFGYLHLLQLLAVKKLQAEHLPIRKIREIVEGRSERGLERLLGESKAKTKNEALSYLETLLISSTGASASSPLLKAAPSPQASYAQPAPAAPQQQQTGGHWERVEIEPGIELHIRDDYRPPVETRATQRLAKAFVRIIESYSQRLGKRGK